MKSQDERETRMKLIESIAADDKLNTLLLEECDIYISIHIYKILNIKKIPKYIHFIVMHSHRMVVVASTSFWRMIVLVLSVVRERLVG